MRAIPLLTLMLGGYLVTPAQAATDASQWLDRLTQAEQKQSFQGTFVYERSGSFSTHDIWHRAQGGGITERLLQLDGSAQEVVRVNGRTTCVSGSLAAGVGVADIGERSDAGADTLDPLKLMSWYDLSVAGESRVAGRKAVVIKLEPKDQYRYAFELHLDEETGLVLKSLLLDERGHLLERLQYTRLQASAPAEIAVQATPNCKPVLRDVPVRADVAAVNWRSEWVPPGFELKGASVRDSTVGKVQVTSLAYADGLARFSVFMEPLKGSRGADSRDQLGPTAAVSRRVNTGSGEVLVTVVGEIPIGTAERIALSMRPQDARTQR